MDFNDFMQEAAEKFFLENGNKIVKEKTLNEYLNSLSKDELFKIAFMKVYTHIEEENIKKIKSGNKKDIIEFIKDNLYEILETILFNIRYEYIEQLKIVVNSEVDKEYSLYSVKFNYLFIAFLKTFCLADVEYNKDERTLKFFMPKEFKVILNELFKDKNVIKVIKKSCMVYKYVEDVLGTYGIIELEKLYEIVNSRLFRIDKDEFDYIIYSKILSEEFYIYHYGDKELICYLNFSSEEDAIDFYNNQTMDYKLYNKQEYKLISSGEYVEKIKTYTKFINYLYDNFGVSKEDMDEIKEMIIIDYIYSARSSLDVADSNFRTNIVKFFDIDNFMIEYLLNLLKKIYDDYPKWIKRGNI